MKLLVWLMRRAIHSGRLTLIGPDGAAHVIDGARDGPEVALRITARSTSRRIFANPELGFAESYMDGGLEIAQGTLRDVMRLFFSNWRSLANTPVQSTLTKAWLAARRLHQLNTPGRARRNASAHYDIGNDLYRLFLDADMQYSCAYFPTGDESLEEAQLAKKRHIAAKLMLRDGQRVLDIGCGWGGMALYLAQTSNVEVVGVTLAEEQLRVARERAQAAGLSDRVRFELMDYRAVEERFDRVVSVGMLEHVGAAFLPEYFRNVFARLAPDGLALIHTIITTERRSVTGPFVRKYIFPGGYTPALSETQAAVEDADLWLQDCEIWRMHYAYTLAEWSKRFAANRARAKALYDERFCRMWELYLAGAEAGFTDGTLAVAHLQLGRDRRAAPITRDYLADETERLQAQERESAVVDGSLRQKAS